MWWWCYSSYVNVYFLYIYSVDGYCLDHSITRTDVAGRDVTSYLKNLLRKEGYRLTTTTEFEILDEMKCECCEVIKYPNLSPNEKQYTLPDGNIITMKSKSVAAPYVLFDPSLIGSEEMGVAECVIQSIMKADIDLRRSLFNSIVLSGGSTLFKGFGKQLLEDITEKAPPKIGIRISVPPKRQISAWVGGSLLASLPSFKDQWYTKEQYNDDKCNI